MPRTGPDADVRMSLPSLGDITTMTPEERRVLSLKASAMLAEVAGFLSALACLAADDQGHKPMRAVDAEEAAAILGESVDWLRHRGRDADKYHAAIRMGGGKISGYDVDGLMRWRTARTGPQT